MLPQLSLTSPHVMPRPAQVADTQRAAVPPVPGEANPVVPRAVPPVGALLLGAKPPVPCTGGAVPPELATVFPSSVVGAVETLLLQEQKKMNSHAAATRVL